MTNRSRRTFRRSGARRSTLWLPFDDTIALATSGAAVQSADLLANYFTDMGEEVPIGTTITWTRMVISYGPTTPQDLVASRPTLQGFLALVPEGGYAQIPDPGAEIVNGFMYFNMDYKYESYRIAAADTFITSPTQKSFESEGQRKTQSAGQQVAGVFVQDSSTDFNVRIHGNILLKLP